jgi:hypothetical protein
LYRRPFYEGIIGQIKGSSETLNFGKCFSDSSRIEGRAATRILQGLVFIGLYALFAPKQFPPWVLLVIVGIVTFPYRRDLIMLVANPMAFAWFILDRIDRSGFHFERLSTFGAIITSLAVFVFWGIFMLKQRKFNLGVVLLMTSVVPLGGVVVNLLHSETWTLGHEVGRVALYAYARGIWFALFWCAIDTSRDGGVEVQSWVRIKNSLVALNPFWNMLLVPVPGALKNTSFTNSEFVSTQASGLRLLCFLVIPLHVGFELIQILAEESLILRVAVDSGMETHSVAQWVPGLSRAELWLSGAIGGSIYIAKRAMEYGCMIAMARVCGFPVLAEVKNVFRSTSFFDFLKRLSFHYVELLTRVWIVPALQASSHLLKRLGVSRARGSEVAVLVSISSGLIVGGVTHQLALSTGAIASMGMEYLKKALIESYYYFFIAVGVLISVILERNRRGTIAGWKYSIGQILRVFIYLMFFSVLLLMLGHSQRVWGDPLRAFVTLYRMLGLP